MSVGYQRGQILTVRQFLTDILQWGVARGPHPYPDLSPRHSNCRNRCRVICRRTPTGGLTDTLEDLSARGPTPLTRLHADALLFTRATGLRIGELRELELDCVHEIDGHGAWLKVPLGKLATERMVPLDTETVDTSSTGSPTAAPPAGRCHTHAPGDRSSSCSSTKDAESPRRRCAPN
jgi:integrase